LCREQPLNDKGFCRRVRSPNETGFAVKLKEAIRPRLNYSARPAFQTRLAFGIALDLRETLEMFEDEQTSYAEGFLGSHRYADRASVERAVAWIVDSYAKDQDPGQPEIRLWSKIREHQPDGYFDFTMTRFDQSGEQRIC